MWKDVYAKHKRFIIHTQMREHVNREVLLR